MTGEPVLDAPRVVAIEPAELQQRVCGQACRVYAWYAPDGMIYLDSRLNPETSIMAKSVLVHELVHHIQRMRLGGPAADCDEWARREREAFGIQASWLRMNGLYPNHNWFRSRQVTCSAGAG